MYPDDVPPPEGMPQRPNRQTSWLFRRNYTWFVIDNSAQASQWWDATGHSFTSARNKGPPGHDSILCALNTFGQDDLFKFPPDFNGYCVRNEKYNEGWGWQQVPRTSRCLITFGASTKKKKRDEANDDDAWEVLSESHLPPT